jgi:hypothetical protein
MTKKTKKVKAKKKAKKLAQLRASQFMAALVMSAIGRNTHGLEVTKDQFDKIKAILAADGKPTAH